jgi:hypothetical protein
MVVATQARNHVHVRVPEFTSAKQRRELSAFARYCILRMERELGERGCWTVDIVLSVDGYSSRIAVDDSGLTLEASGTGRDGALATWEAMCRIEQRLRDRLR